MNAKTSTPTETELLAARLEEALMQSGMSATQFGYLHFGNPAFFTRLRRGHRFHSATVKRIEALLEELEV